MIARHGVPISVASVHSGLKVPTIRYYEQIGLLPKPERTESNRRRYHAADLRRLVFILPRSRGRGAVVSVPAPRVAVRRRGKSRDRAPRKTVRLGQRTMRAARRRMASGLDVNTIRLWDVTTGTPMPRSGLTALSAPARPWQPGRLGTMRRATPSALRNP
jgi:hypothetical protein